jgi:hypothetical protein
VLSLCPLMPQESAHSLVATYKIKDIHDFGVTPCLRMLVLR